MTAGSTHPFYTLLLTLILLSLCLQVSYIDSILLILSDVPFSPFPLKVLQAVLCLVLGFIFDLNKVDEQRNANICNNIGVCLVVVIVVINIVITAFNYRDY